MNWLLILVGVLFKENAKQYFNICKGDNDTVECPINAKIRQKQFKNINENVKCPVYSSASEYK